MTTTTTTREEVVNVVQNARIAHNAELLGRFRMPIGDCVNEKEEIASQLALEAFLLFKELQEGTA
ncbi:MAG: hypothetical protein IBX68_11610 [Dehalococcoidia bacterium]|nr:hypothetical protein [Dehalococcoidia bacterium]